MRRSTPAMRARIRELSRPYNDDYDRAVIAVLDDFEVVLAQSNAEPVGVLHNTGAGFKEAVTRDTAAIYDNNPQTRLVEEIFDFDRKLIGFRVYDAPPRPDAEPVADEGHHTLCKILRAMEPWPCKQAANEIERLARDLRLAESARDYANDVLAYAKEQLAQSDAEPVAWREALEQQLFDLVELARDRRDASRVSAIEWLHPSGALVSEFSKRIGAPPRPDASAGLIEAAEMAEKEASGWTINGMIVLQEFARKLRARAAERSESANPNRPK